jgi:putative sterol carrier protein
MEWTIDCNQPIDEELRDSILDKIEEGTFCAEDLRQYFTVFTQICNDTEDIQDEVEGINRKFLIKLEGQPTAWLKIEDLKFEMGEGDIDAPDTTLDMSAQLAVDIFSGQVDPTAAYMSGELKVDGILIDAILFRTLLDLVQEELE